MNNTPPQILSTSLDAVTTFDHINGANFSLNATVTDAETPGNLTYAWQTFLYHNDHNHPEAIDNNPSTSTHLSPIGCEDDATLWYRVELTVTDPSGLSAFYSKDIYPDCPGTAQTITFIRFQINRWMILILPYQGLPLLAYRWCITLLLAQPWLVESTIMLLGVPGEVTVVGYTIRKCHFCASPFPFSSLLLYCLQDLVRVLDLV